MDIIEEVMRMEVVTEDILGEFYRFDPKDHIYWYAIT